MKLRQFLQPFDSSFSTPKAIRKLLHLFAVALVLAFYAGACIYLCSVFRNEISLRRSHMNVAISDAENFFVSRQTLLKALGLAAVRDVTGLTTSASFVAGEEVYIDLGDGNQRWGLFLTKRMISYFRQNNVNLLYVPQAQRGEVKRLFSAESPVSIISMSVLQRLRRVQDDSNTNSNVMLIVDQKERDSTLYIFVRLDEGNSGLGWLGLEVKCPDLMRALRHKNAGQFMLLDPKDQLIYASASQGDVSQLLKQLPASRSFELVGRGWLPDHLAIRRPLGKSDWQIVYAIDVQSLLPAFIIPLLLSFLVCGFATWILSWMVRRIDRTLIIPAIHRIESLVESEAFSRAVIHIAPVALCVIRRQDGALVLENSLSQQWLGSSNERQKLCHDWIRRAFSNVQQTGTDEIEMYDGRHFYLSFAPTRYKREDVLICAFSDISAHKQIETTLQQARQLADSANEAKTLFLATMSHEIRTPLYGVLGTLELLARTELSHQQDIYLKAIEGSSANLLQLICDVLDVSRIEAGQLQLEMSSFSPLSLIEGSIQSYSAAAHNKGLQLFACIDPQLPKLLRGDEKRIRQILNNLINNAIKFTDSGRVVLRVRIKDRNDEQVLLQLQVSDTGVGIQLEDQRKLFDPFYQVGGNNHLMAGTGLGLSICQRLVNLMGGSIRVVSEPGLGSSFTMNLSLERFQPIGETSMREKLMPQVVYVLSPVRELAESICGWLNRWGAIARIGLPNINDAPMHSVLLELHPGKIENFLAPQWRGARILAGSNIHSAHWHDIPIINVNSIDELRRTIANGQGYKCELAIKNIGAMQKFKLFMRVLVVEDNAINQLILRDQLEELGCEVVLASDGVEALELVHKSKFDLLLTDVNMPRMNGYELAIRLRQLNSAIPIIGATANAMLDGRARCIEVGMNHCLIKPFTLQALYVCLEPYQRTRC